MARRNIYNFRYADDTTLMTENEKELKSFLMKMKGESEKSGLKPNIQSANIMPSDPITSWQIEEGKVEAMTGFIFLGSKLTVDGDCSHANERRLVLVRKAVTNLDSLLKAEASLC